MKFKKIILSWQVILLLIILILSFISINYSPLSKGIIINGVMQNTTASSIGFENPQSNLAPLSKERLLKVNSVSINSVEEYNNFIQSLPEVSTLRIKTTEKDYAPFMYNKSTGKLGFRVMETPTSNIRKGLDLQGGSRVLLQPENETTPEQREVIVENLRERMNAFGLSDIRVSDARDLEGEYFIVVEIAGVTEEEVRDLLARQGKFEATIGNKTVFIGGERDVVYVCKDSSCSGIDPRSGCGQMNNGDHTCRFGFSISLSSEAAKRFAKATENLSTTISEDGQEYLEEDIVLYLDDVEVDSLKVSSELQGREVTDIQISGSGVGKTYQEAVYVSLNNMKRLQTIMVTGSLPVSLNVVKMDTLSPILGKEFLANILLVAILALSGVGIVIFIRYRKLKVAIPLVLTLVSELVMILGFASYVGWDLDLAAIAGIIIAIGTGVDHLIIITDEALKGDSSGHWKDKIKKALFVVFGAYMTTLLGMIPLYFAGAGMLKGFAFTTIAGISFGVLIARPAYAAIIRRLLEE